MTLPPWQCFTHFLWCHQYGIAVHISHWCRTYHSLVPVKPLRGESCPTTDQRRIRCCDNLYIYRTSYWYCATICVGSLLISHVHNDFHAVVPSFKLSHIHNDFHHCHLLPGIFIPVNSFRSRSNVTALVPIELLVNVVPVGYAKVCVPMRRSS